VISAGSQRKYDTLCGRIKNGVLALSSNNARIRVDGEYLTV
jgi:hypothetical protein